MKGIYAIGDATNQINLTPVAVRQGRIVALRVFGGQKNLKMSYDNVPSVIFSHPPIGFVGLTEDAAKEKFGADHVVCHTSNFINMYYSPAIEQESKLTSIFKLICHK